MEAADFYTGIVVDAYAKLKSTSFDAQPYADFVRAYGEPALEIGCGDGEPLLELCREGLVVDGIDSSEDMVRRCRTNAARLGLDVAVHCQRVEDLRLERRYRSIYFAGPTLNLLPDDKTALRALQCIRATLTDDGAALIPLWVPPPTPPSQLGAARETENDGVTLRYTALTETYDPDGRTRTTSTRYERITADEVEHVDRDWVIHWHTPAGFTDLCDRAGLTIKRLVDDDSGGTVTDASDSFTATVGRGSATGAE